MSLATPALAAAGFSLAIRVTVLLAAALLLSRLPLRAAVRHAVWTAAVVGALLLPAADLVVPRVETGWGGVSAEALLERWLALPAIALDRRPATPEPSRGSERLARASSLGAGPAGAVERRLDRLAGAALGVWAAGVLVLLLRLAIGWVGGGHRVRAARRIREPLLSRERRLLSADLGLRGAEVPILEADWLSAPATFGWIRPVILLPGTRAQWSIAATRAVIAHELAHVVRRDGLTQLLAEVARAIYWFNPLVWVAARRMSLERERACDDRVLAAGLEPQGYAELLVDWARRALTSPSATRLPQPAMLSMARPSELELRLVAILDPRVRRGPLTRLAGGSVLFSSLALLLGAASLRGSDGGPPDLVPRLDLPPVLPQEPDRRADSLAAPWSERLAGADPAPDRPAIRLALAGPDSLLVRRLAGYGDHQPSWEGDLVRDRARWALAQIRDGELVAPLLEQAGDPDWRVRAYAAWALAVAGDRRATPALIRSLGDPVWRLRAMAAAALRQIGDPGAAPAMARALDDPAWQVRTEVVQYLGETGDPKWVDPVSARLHDRHLAVRGAAQEALAHLTPPR